MVATSKLNFFRGSWIADYPDAENYLSLFYSKNFCPNGPNYTHFKNQEFDLLYEKSLSETNTETRYTYYQKMDKLIIESAVVVPLYYDRVLRFTNKNIKGFESNAMNLLDLKRVSK
jgi:peptide/nickel transport system substrate-binding protein